MILTNIIKYYELLIIHGLIYFMILNVGIHNYNSWLLYAEGKKTTSLHLYDKAKELEDDFIFSRPEDIKPDTDEFDNVAKLFADSKAFYRSHFLLAGYSIELLLKSAICILVEDKFKDEIPCIVKSLSHNLLEIITMLDIELNENETSLIRLLSLYVKDITRYPINEINFIDYFKQQRAHENNFSTNRDNYINLYDKINRYIKKLKGSELNPISKESIVTQENDIISIFYIPTLEDFIPKIIFKPNPLNPDITKEEIISLIEEKSHINEVISLCDCLFLGINQKDKIKIK